MRRVERAVRGTPPRLFLLVAGLLLVGASSVPIRASAAEQADTETVVAAGDIGECGRPGAEATAELLDGLPGTVLALGDEAYDGGTAADFVSCYDPAWGRHKYRTRPIPGNHEYYGTRDLRGYFEYFGPQAPAEYYSYDLGAWHVVALNSNCDRVGCGPGSPQERWLRADLAAHPAACTLAYLHHPRFSSGPHGGEPRVGPLWQALYDAGAAVVLDGHDHLYERFAPQDPAGRVDPVRGIRQFTVGTGGGELYRVRAIAPNSEVRSDDTWGVLRLALEPSSYTWEFIPVAGRSFADAGSATCPAAS